MAEKKKLDRWADKLLDTGKRNNLINFRDSKNSTAEIVYPDCESIFSKCSVGQLFEIFDPKITDDEFDDFLEENQTEEKKERILSREEFINRYSPRIKNSKLLLAYAQTPNPLNSVKRIAKRAREMLDETGNNVSYLAFGFVKWNEKYDSKVFFKAPLLLVHINIITGTITDPIKIEISDDDVIVNPTFDYLLQAEFNAALPVFEDEDTLSSYYQKVTQIVKKLGWTVLDECKLGVFSFLKINMYEDLKKNADQILENENVLFLLGESHPGSVDGDAVPLQTVQNPLIDLHTVIDADSSQIEAIELAKSGKSFVLQGPPGTGKSQTITNIIAECLHDKKKILFVSEKQAALNVVFDKLKKVNLADFCLELHSHKANKKAVIEELNRTLEIPKSFVSSRTEDEIRLKRDAQRALDTYAFAIHSKRGSFKKSLYQLFELYAAQRNYPDLKFTIPYIQNKTQEDLLQTISLLEQYTEFTSSIGQYYKSNPWYGFTKTHLSYNEQNQLREDMEQVIHGYKNLKEKTIQIKNKYEAPALTFSDTVWWQSFLDFCAKSDVITPSLLTKENFSRVSSSISKMKELSKTILPLRSRILENYIPDVLTDFDGKNLYNKLTEQYKSFFSRLFSREYKNIISKMQTGSRAFKEVNYQQAVVLSQNLMNLQAAEAEYKEKEAAISGCLGNGYQGPETNWGNVSFSFDVLQRFHSDTPNFGKLAHMNSEEFFSGKRTFQEEADELSNDISVINVALKRVSECFSSDVLDLQKNSYNECLSKLERCLDEFDKLGNWMGFLLILSELQTANLIPFIDTINEKEINPDQIVGTYKRTFFKQLIENILFENPGILAFSRIRHDQAVRIFSEKDMTQFEISQLQIQSELSQQRPSLSLIAGDSAVGIIRREGQKKRKQMPIRRLLSETGSLVQILKPCFLMSPLSVSTFLDPAKIKFDTVIFDEASQIFPQDAIGAIYRGKQLIVVGDSKQMPPTNFFNSSTDIEDDSDEIGDITDFESILDICSSVFTTKSLAWHYRSHYEQLIAFSNLNFYRNNLITFPSSSLDHKGIGVDYYYVNGCFDRKSRTNKEEAQYIVDLIFRNIEEYPDRSVGVVAFSAAQQSLIDHLLAKKRESLPIHEDFFSTEKPEPFFIKNLETVQGDERDTIIFSVAYAKDNEGHFIQNFGPLNRVGGERRLNVAVTRAKENIQLVSSLHFTDIDLSTTKSEGVRLLRAYLDYAQNGEEALERAISIPASDQYDSDFEQEVCDFLREQGFTVDTQVGCSGYKIDLGLREPDSSNYVLAIECDGATYHSSKNARDRDRLRQEVLENMGWVFYRIWSTDWYRNNTVEKQNLLDTAKRALARGQNKNRKKPFVKPEIMPRGFTVQTTDTEIRFEEYKQVDAMSHVRNYRHDFQGAIRKILEIEGPLSEEFLLKRIVSYFDREKVTNVVLTEYNNLMYRCENRGIIRKDGFLYLNGRTEYKLRIPGDKRDIKYIPLEELEDGMYMIIKQNISITKDSLFKKLTGILGFTRTGDNITNRYNQALSNLVINKKIKNENDTLSITSA